MFKKDLENENILIETLPDTEAKHDMVAVKEMLIHLKAEVARLEGLVAEAESKGVLTERVEKVNEVVEEKVEEVVEK